MASYRAQTEKIVREPSAQACPWAFLGSRPRTWTQGAEDKHIELYVTEQFLSMSTR